MKIQYCSDLHLEFVENKNYIRKNPLKSAGDLLLLAGDVIPLASMHKHKDFLNYLSDNFPVTYWIPGNHEYYGYDLAKKTGSFCEQIRDNVLLTNNHVIVHQDVRFIFSSLWSHINPVNEWAIQQSISDFHVIKFGKKKLTALQFNKLHEECLEFLTNALEQKCTEKTVVVTHHVPTLLNYPEKYKRDFLNEAFAVELYYFIEAHKPDYWVYGHHHTNTPAFKIGETTMLTNQLGYVSYNENEAFDSHALISI